MVQNRKKRRKKSSLQTLTSFQHLPSSSFSLSFSNLFCQFSSLFFYASQEPPPTG